jgi:transcriptional regulator with XRE-family HTH domain
LNVLGRVIELRLKELLRERGISQEELSLMSRENPADPKSKPRLSKSTVSELCNNIRDSINKKKIGIVADILEIEDISELITIRKD